MSVCYPSAWCNYGSASRVDFMCMHTCTCVGVCVCVCVCVCVHFCVCAVVCASRCLRETRCLVTGVSSQCAMAAARTHSNLMAQRFVTRSANAATHFCTALENKTCQERRAEKDKVKSTEGEESY